MRIVNALRSEAGEIGRARWLRSMHAWVTRTPLSTRDESNQRLRLNRFLLASAFSMLYLVVLAIFYTQGKLDGDTLFAACAIVLALIVVFFSVFRLGLNL